MAANKNESPIARGSTTAEIPTPSVPRDLAALAARGPPVTTPIVAIGASAGGLEAVSKLLDRLPPTLGIAYILVQHLDPMHKSLMAELLGEHTAMKVVEAGDESPLSANQIHIIPPGRYLSVHAGAVRLSAPQIHRGARLPFDFLLGSLAKNHGSKTICVVLSGTGADGSGSLSALKAAGGYIIAQQPEEADYDGMPRNAIGTGLVDQVLPLHDIPQALADCAVRIVNDMANHAPAVPEPSPGIDEIISFLKDKTSHDFRQYKPGTLERRIERRMVLLALERGDFAQYLGVLRNDPDERHLLAKDLLISVTSFFRDPAAFLMLATAIIPDIIHHLAEHQPLRIWVAGCSTGEEAYSIAMVCRDAIESSGREIKLQVFASDVDAHAIVTAREGLYPLDIAERIKADQLTRYFVREEAGYRVTTTLRGDVVFTVHDVLSDPPFSKIDLVSCRNLLIYLNPEAQAKVVSLFHFALRRGGILMLGSSETIGAAEDKFEVIAKSERFYRRIARSRPGGSSFLPSFGETLPALPSPNRTIASPRQTSLADICRKAVLASHGPAAILINSKRQCLYSMGPTDRYLRIAPGYATLDILAMATPALRTKLRLAIGKAGKAAPRVSGGRTRMTRNGVTIWFSIDVQWLSTESEDMLLVCFLEETGQEEKSPSRRSRIDATRLAELEQELEATQAELQSSILNQETSSQEQKAINEETLSANEEIQSTNEELLTSKEELQSLNEELTALNSQLQETLERQRLTSDDLQNVLYSTNVGTLFLDMELRIRFYTPAIKWLFNIISGDVGRPLGDLRPIVADPDLLNDARQALTDELPIEREISAPGDAWFLRRIFPYRAHDNRVEGVVITFADITERKVAAKALEAAKIEAERANLAKSRFLAAASHDLRQHLQSLTLLQELLTQSVEGGKQQKLLTRFEQTLGAMSGMLNALLDINQIEAGVVEAKPIIFPIADLFDRLKDEFTYLSQTRGLSLHIQPSAALTRSDPRLLEQMIRNLLSNAIKYTKRGKILLGCRRRGDRLRIEVWDTGIGIADDELHAIFDEFHQVDNPGRERSRGLGLGLSIVQRLGRLLGHDIDVRSTPGKGSIFAVTIACPVRDPSVPSTDMVNTDRTDLPRHQREILVVDDDPDVLELTEQLLVGEGHVVKAVPDAATALKLINARAVCPDILLTDYNLSGGMSGLELLIQLRASEKIGLPGIILTGDISRETLAKIAKQDCVQLSKPVKPAEIVAAIERFHLPAKPPAARRAKAITRQRAPVTYVVDDDPEIRVIIRDVLESDQRVVQDFASAEAFLESYQAGGEGCLLVDAHLPGMSGVSLLGELRARGDYLPVVLITGRSDVGLAVEAMRTGACDFIEKPVGRAELQNSIARAIDQSHDIQLINAVHEEAVAHVAGLTTRQREVMDLVLAGHPSKNIAVDLGISRRTVENHRAAIMRKMGVKSLPELARTAQAALRGSRQPSPAVASVGEFLSPAWRLDE